MATKPGGARENETQFADRAEGPNPWYPYPQGLGPEGLGPQGLAAGKDCLAMNLLQGHEATCPHCWETISLTLDLSVPEQSYIEDCPVCCRPMLVSYSAADGELDALSVDPSD